MSDFRTVAGFEDNWRPPVRSRRVRPSTLAPQGAPAADAVRARLTRIATRAPEVMVKVTGRTREAAHLRAHLDYISRNGRQALEGPDGVLVLGRGEISDLAREWASTAEADNRQRSNTPLSLSVVLSMPAGTNALDVRDAARAFAVRMFADRHAYVFTLHTDTPRPHVHLSICARSNTGERLNPKKADLEMWRQSFAEALRDRGVEAEATPRRTRGVTRKSERTAVRKIADRHARGLGPIAQTQRAAYLEAAKAAFQGDVARRPWEQRLLDRQARVRSLYLAQARLLATSPDAEDRRLAEKVSSFVRSMPDPDSQRLRLARDLRSASWQRRNREQTASRAGEHGKER